MSNGEAVREALMCEDEAARLDAIVERNTQKGWVPDLKLLAIMQVAATQRVAAAMEKETPDG